MVFFGVLSYFIVRMLLNRKNKVRENKVKNKVKENKVKKKK
jgi:hypothetical protein